MRLGDDLVDLENEAVQRILDVVKDDKYAVDVWTGILEKGKNGRRCGLEFTAMSDMCAAMGYKFCIGIEGIDTNVKIDDDIDREVSLEELPF